MTFDNTSFEILEASPLLAILGIGAFEQHSHHLPVETDYLLAKHLSSDVAARLGAFLLNPLPYSTSLEHLGFAGTVTLRPETLGNVIKDIAYSLGRFAVRYLAVLNCHGGNFVLNPVIREWNLTGASPAIMLIEGLTLKSGYPEGELHSGEMETSIMQYLEPDLVKLDRAVDFVPDALRPDLTHFGMKGLSPEGVWGRPTRATREKGERWYRESIETAVEMIETCLERFEKLCTADVADVADKTALGG